MDELLDEADAEFLSGWDEADADALTGLDEVLTEVGDRPCPQHELQAAAERLRTGPASDEGRRALLASCAGLRPDALPADDAESWLTLAAGVVAPVDEPPSHYEPEELSSWYALMHADWLCAVGELARGGPGAPADEDTLARYVATSDLAEGALEPDDVSVLAAGFVMVTELWRLLGAVDDERLTALGWWGLPEGLCRAWSGPDDAE